MRKITLSPDHCTYIIVSAATIDELEININEIIENGWNADGSVSGGWEFIGGIGSDGTSYFQAMKNCPLNTGKKIISNTDQDFLEYN